MAFAEDLGTGAQETSGRRRPDHRDLQGRQDVHGADRGGGRGEEPKLTEVKLTDNTKIEFVGAGKDLKRKLKVGDGVDVSLEGGVPALDRLKSTPRRTSR